MGLLGSLVSDAAPAPPHFTQHQLQEPEAIWYFSLNTEESFRFPFSHVAGSWASQGFS